MSSSTSSFRRELKVIIFVLAVLLGVEVAMRRLGSAFSRELRYLRDIPNRAEKMDRSDKFRILILGNSLTNCGFNSQEFEMEMDSMGAKPLHIEIIAMNGAGICEWSWLLQNFLWDDNRNPDLIIVNGSRLWEDEKNANISRLSLYLDAEDILPVLAEDITEFERRMQFLHAYTLSSYAGRARVKLMTLNNIIPNYLNGRKEVHRVAQLQERTTKKTQRTTEATYRQMARLADGAVRRHIPVIFVLMPTERIYDLQSTGFYPTARSAGVEVADCRDAVSMLEGGFVDSSHMNEKGARIFSRELARRLWDQLPHLFERLEATGKPAKPPSPN